MHPIQMKWLGSIKEKRVVAYLLVYLLNYVFVCLMLQTLEAVLEVYFV